MPLKSGIQKDYLDAGFCLGPYSRRVGHETIMKVEVRLYATLRKYGPVHEGPFVMDLIEGERLGRLMELVGMPPDVEKVILVNGRPGEQDSILKDGDLVVIFPPVAGG
jgi:molybdopterin synthase sulfur carrier subunit